MFYWNRVSIAYKTPAYKMYNGTNDILTCSELCFKPSINQDNFMTRVQE